MAGTRCVGRLGVRLLELHDCGTWERFRHLFILFYFSRRLIVLCTLWFYNRGYRHLNVPMYISRYTLPIPGELFFFLQTNESLVVRGTWIILKKCTCSEISVISLRGREFQERERERGREGEFQERERETRVLRLRSEKVVSRLNR